MNGVYKIFKKTQASCVAHICNPDTEEDEAEGSQLRNSLDYTARSGLKLIVTIIIKM